MATVIVMWSLSGLDNHANNTRGIGGLEPGRFCPTPIKCANYLILSFSVPPTIDPTIVSDFNLSVIVAHPVAIDCPANGIPPPDVLWYKDGFPVHPDLDPNVRVISGGRRLEISSAEVGDTGKYQCVAKNKAGKVDQQFVLYVWGE